MTEAVTSSTRTCKGCGGEIPPTRRADALYCTRRCAQRQYNTAHGAKERAVRSALPKRCCSVCGIILPAPLQPTRALYCSKACQRVIHRATANARHVPVGPFRCICRQCGASFLGRRNRRYCSTACRKLRYRLAHAEQCRISIQRRNKERYHSDSAFRAELRQNTKAYRKRMRRHGVGITIQAKEAGFRSTLELKLSRELAAAGVNALYEPKCIYYTDARRRRYLPDFVLPNGVCLEAKGWYLSSDRTKHRLIKAEYPDLDLRFVFANPANRLGTKSQTTYAKWCDTHGFQHAHGSIPEAWLREPPNEKSLAVLASFGIDPRK